MVNKLEKITRIILTYLILMIFYSIIPEIGHQIVYITGLICYGILIYHLIFYIQCVIIYIVNRVTNKDKEMKQCLSKMKCLLAQYRHSK